MKPLITATEVPVISNQFWRGNDVNHVDVLADIYQENTNIVFWKRSLTDKLLEASNIVLSTNPDLEISLVVSPQDTVSVLQGRLNYKNNLHSIRTLCQVGFTSSCFCRETIRLNYSCKFTSSFQHSQSHIVFRSKL